MEQRTILENIRNYIGGSIDANGNVIVGDNNTIVVNIYKFEDYKKLKATLQSLESDLTEAQKAYQESPNNYIAKQIEGFYTKIETTQEEVETFEKEIIALANDLTKISINTERLRTAQVYFLDGKQNEARAFLESEKEAMKQEQTALLNKKEQLEKDIEETENALINNANEYLLLARLTIINFDLSNRIQLTKNYFELSLISNSSNENLEEYANFLLEYMYLNEALNIFELLISKLYPNINSEKIAEILNKIGCLHKSFGNYTLSSKIFNRSLKIRRKLASNNSNKALFQLSQTFHNLGNLYSELSNYKKANQYYKKSLTIRIKLTQKNQEKYAANLLHTLEQLIENDYKNEYLDNEITKQLYIFFLDTYEKSSDLFQPEMINILIKLTLLYEKENNFEEGIKTIKKSISIIKNIFHINPNSFQQHLAFSLVKLGILSTITNYLDEAELALTEALEHYRNLFNADIEKYGENLISLLHILTSFYITHKKNDGLAKYYLMDLIHNILLIPNLESQTKFKPYIESIHSFSDLLNIDIMEYLNEI